MAGRRLNAEELALWRRITADVRPIAPRHPSPRPVDPASPPAVAPRAPFRPAVQAPVAVRGKGPGETLDGGWDRRLRRGVVAPDLTIDLHGHTLASAHALLDASLDRALANDARLVLVITGRPPRPSPDGGAPRRGLIRASIGHWLATSRHASRIAAVRGAHPRHGGAGALYVVLRRSR